MSSTAKTAAAIGIVVTANTHQASQALTALNKQATGLGGSRLSNDLATLGWLGDKGLDGLQKLTTGMGRAAVGATKLGMGIGAIGAVGVAIGLTEMATSLGTTGAAAGRAADRLGMPVERLSQFQIAARLAGGSAEDMTSSLASLQATVSDAAYGRDNDAWSAFRAAGIDVGDAVRGAKDYASILPRIADETQKLAKVDRNAALRFLDKVGVSRDLFPVLRNGSAGLQSYLDEAKQFAPLTQKQAEDARELEKVMTALGLRFEDFERIGGAAVAPGLTKFLNELQTYLHEHQADVTAFFGTIEHGIEWLTQPKNLAWLREELDSATDGLKHLYGFVLQIEHSPLLRRIFGLPAEGPQDETPIGNGIAMEDDGGRLERAIKDAGQARPNRDSLSQSPLFNAHPGNPKGSLQPQLQALSDAAADANGVPRDFAKTIFGLEGGLNPDGSPRTSRAGAVGAGQLMPATAAKWGVDPRVLSENVTGSIEEMRALLDQFHGNEAAAAAGYNAGPNNEGVQYFARTGDPSHLPPETRKYIEAWSLDASSKQRNRDRRDPQDESPAPTGAPPSYAPPIGSGSDTDLSSKRRDKNRPDQHAETPLPLNLPSYSVPDASDPDGRLHKLQVELRHINPPPGSQLSVVNADPATIDVIGPKSMGAMPTSGQLPRNIARDGY